MAAQAHFSRSSWIERRFGSPLDMILSPEVRAILALIMLVGFGVWFWQNRDIAIEYMKQMPGSAVDPVELAKAKGPMKVKASVRDYETRDVDVQALDVGDTKLPPRTASLLGSWNAIAAGVLLLLSLPYRSKALGLLVIAGSLVAVLGPGMSSVGALPIVARFQATRLSMAGRVGTR